jgi:hypothetical protein
MATRFAESYLAHMPDVHTGEQFGNYLEQFFREMVAVRKKYFPLQRRFLLSFFLPHYKRFIRKCYSLTPDIVADSQ